MVEDNLIDEVTGRYKGKPSAKQFSEDKSLNISAVRVAATGLVSSVPCRLYSLDMIGAQGQFANAIIYNGRNTNGERLIDLRSSAYEQDKRKYNPPINLTRGMYIVFDGNVTSVLVRYAI